MLDWLRRPASEEPTIEVAGRALPVVLRRLPQARRMTLRLAPDGSEVRLSIPQWGRTAEALEFARSRSGWLAAQIAALPQPAVLGAGGLVPFRGEEMLITHDPRAPRRPLAAEGTIRLGGPEEGLSGRLKRWLEGEARLLLAEDLAHYCARADLPMAKLSLSSAQRRWGSCSGKGDIRINWRLIMAPDAVRRSVVAHEVAHLVHFDHSPRFHAMLIDLFDGDMPAANHWLKRHGRGLYSYFG